MKTNKKNQLLKVILMVTVWSIFISCTKKNDEDIVPDKDPKNSIVELSDLKLSGNDGSAELITDANTIVETTNGYKIEGTIAAKIEGVGEMQIAEGEFEYKLDGNGAIESIKGVGSPEFPKVGIFAKIREGFNWEKVKSHIEYEYGRFYISTYETEIPLNKDRKYLHYQVFDQEGGDFYQLKDIGNKIVYKFLDLYIDPTDPAIFFKTQIPWPEGESGEEASNIVLKLLGRVTDSTPWKYADSPGVILGISNQATIKSGSYEFSKPENFQELLGFEGFEEINSHSYMKLSGIPLPPVPVLTFTGEMYTHRFIDLAANPELDIEEQQQAVVDWFTQKEFGPYAHTFSGSIDFAGSGIGLVLSVLQGLDEIVGRQDFLNNDFDLDLGAATFQTQFPDLNRETPAFMRFGGEISKPMLANLFGEEISKYIPSQPTPTGFLYINIGDELDKWSVFVESTADLMIPFIGLTELSNSYFLIQPDGITVEGNVDLPDFEGVFDFDRSFSGYVGVDGFELSSDYNKEISLPNGIILTSKNTTAHISSTDGFTMEGAMDLPLGIVGVEFSASASKEKATFEGEINQGIDIGNGMELPASALKFSASTDPNEGILFDGELNVPHVGFTKVTGSYSSSSFEFTGDVNGTINFNGVELPIANGQLKINQDGITLDGLFTLPYGLKTAQLSGTITKEGINLSGKMASGIDIGGYNFQFSNSYINASSSTGVKLGGSINLKVFTASVAGAIYPGGAFSMTGSKNFNTSVLTTSMKIVVTQSKVDLIGSGTIKSPIWPYPSYTGTITFKPNWAAGTIDACIGSFCIGM